MKSKLKIDQDGTKVWRNSLGQLHRLDGPAIKYANGAKSWYQYGKRHRIDGPAVIWPDGTKWWYKNDRLYII